MSDIFISYAREDRALADQLAEVLVAQGWSVWWDRNIASGEPFDQVIEDALAAARCVIVLWSAHSVGSRWVRAEAGEGLSREVLVPIMVDEVQAPLAFRRIHAERLLEWEGGPTPELNEVLGDIASMLGRPGVHIAPVRKRAWGGQRGVIAALGVAGLLTLLAVVGRAWTSVQLEREWLGQWRGEVQYSWGPVVTEQFQFVKKHDSVNGKGSFLGVPRRLFDVQRRAREVSFEIRWAETIGEKTQPVINRYEATLRGDEMYVRLQDDRNYPPVEFVLARVDEDDR